MAPKTLVVPLDGSAFAERALPIAAAIARRIGGAMLLVSAQYDGPLHPRDYLQEQAAACGPCPIDVIATEETRAAETIVDAVVADDGRVVCMTTHGRGGLRWAALGSVAEDVLRRSDRPILLVGRNCRTDFLERSSHLLVCTDGGDECRDQLGPVARDWAELVCLDTHLATVVHPLDVESAEHSDALLDSLVEQFGVGTRSNATLVRSRYVAGALADLADELPAAIIAMHCHARHGLNRFALGSDTMGVVHLAPCPLLVTHPAA